MIDLHHRFGKRISARRRQCGLTQAELATAAGLSVGMISKLERGACGARFPVIERLAAVLKLDPGELFREGWFEAVEHPALKDIVLRLEMLSATDVTWVRDLLVAALARLKSEAAASQLPPSKPDRNPAIAASRGG